MATKAQLEAELAELRQQLAQQARRDDSGSEAELAKSAERPGDDATDPDAEADNPDWETQLQEVLKEVEDLPHKKPLLLALGALALGYLIGRSR